MNKLRRLTITSLVLGVALAMPAAAAQEHQPTRPAEQGRVDAPATHSAAEHEGGDHEGLSALLWPTANFIVLVGALWWFFKQPIAAYLSDRHSSIRQDLVAAANVKAAASADLAEIDRKLQALPGEIDALKRRGAEEIAAEEERIATLAAAERERLLEQTRREIDLQVRLAKRELLEHAADLAVQLASDRIQQTITPADQDRLVDRYLQGVSRPDASASKGAQ